MSESRLEVLFGLVEVGHELSGVVVRESARAARHMCAAS